MAERTIEIDRTDLDSFLEALAERLRADALALAGYAALHAPFHVKEQDQELEALSGSLRRTATVLAGIGDALCEECRIREITERVVLASPKKASKQR